MPPNKKVNKTVHFPKTATSSPNPTAPHPCRPSRPKSYLASCARPEQPLPGRTASRKATIELIASFPHHPPTLPLPEIETSPAPTMITRYITDVTTRFNPFSPRAKAARLFLTRLPPGARAAGMNITTQLLARTSTEPSSLWIKFSALLFQYSPQFESNAAQCLLRVFLPGVSTRGDLCSSEQLLDVERPLENPVGEPPKKSLHLVNSRAPQII